MERTPALPLSSASSFGGGAVAVACRRAGRGGNHLRAAMLPRSSKAAAAASERPAKDARSSLPSAGHAPASATSASSPHPAPAALLAPPAARHPFPASHWPVAHLRTDAPETSSPVTRSLAQRFEEKRPPPPLTREESCQSGRRPGSEHHWPSNPFSGFPFPSLANWIG